MQENDINNPLNQSVSDSVPVIEQPLPAGEAGKQSNFLVILLSILLLLSVLIAGFFAFQTQKLIKELTLLRTEATPVANIEPTIEPLATSSSTTADPTVNWKTYTNTEYNFLFKYPSYLEDKGGISGPYTGTNIAIRSFSDPKTMAEGTDMPFDGYALYYVSDIKASNFETYIQNEKSAMDNAEYAAMTGARRISLQNRGVAFVTDMRGYYYFPSDDGKKVVVLGYIQQNQSFKLVFDQILSTFKFTN